MDNKAINEQLKAITAKYRTTTAEARDRSHAEYVKTLPAGQPVPEKGKIYGEAAREAFNDACRGLTSSAAEIIGQEQAAIKESMTAAPSADAVNTLQLLNMRSNLTYDELQDVADRYGDNYQAGRTLVSIAHQHQIRGIKYAGADLEARAAQLDTLANCFTSSTFSAKAADEGKAGGFMDYVDQIIDNTYPTE